MCDKFLVLKIKLSMDFVDARNFFGCTFKIEVVLLFSIYLEFYDCMLVKKMKLNFLFTIGIRKYRLEYYVTKGDLII